MKKALSSLYVVAGLVFVLFAMISCDQAPDPKPPEENKSVPEKVFVIMPSDNSTYRWVLYDQPALQSEFTKAGLTSQFAYSNYDTVTEASLVQTAIDDKFDILVISVVGSTNSFESVETAKAAGLIVILYDRVVEGNTTADYYVSYDNDNIGQIQGDFLVNRAASDIRGEFLPLYLYTGHLDDHNSKRFFSGAWSKLQPKIADGTFTIMNSAKATEYQDVAELSETQILEIITEKNTQWNESVAAAMALADINEDTPEGLVYILAPNDNTSRAIAEVFYDNGNTMVITGQDGEIASLQAVLDGNQSMTILKPFKYIAEALAPVFAALRAGNMPVLPKMYNNGTKEIPFISAVPILIKIRADIEACVDEGLIDGTQLDWGD